MPSHPIHQSEVGLVVIVPFILLCPICQFWRKFDGSFSKGFTVHVCDTNVVWLQSSTFTIFLHRYSGLILKVQTKARLILINLLKPNVPVALGNALSMKVFIIF